MTADRHSWSGKAVKGFDYSAMAEETLERIATLEKGLARLKSWDPAVPSSRNLIHSRILLLEEELMEQRSLYKLFCRKAKERESL